LCGLAGALDPERLLYRWPASLDPWLCYQVYCHWCP